MTSKTIERPGSSDKPSPFTMLTVENTDPFGFYEAIRGRGPLVWDEVMNGWLVLDYAHCLEIEFNEDRFSNPYAGAGPLMTRIKGGASNITLTQGELHKKLRLFHQQLLSPRAVASYRKNLLAPIIDHLMARILAKGGKADLAADFADQVPPRLTAALFGMPWQDDALVNRILHLHEEIMAWIGRKHAGEDLTQRAITASDQINAILLPFIRDRRDHPADDFASRVWLDAHEFFDDFDEEDALGICREIFLGGSDTTVHGIANCFYLLLTEPELRAAVTADRDKALNNFVEEAMRIYGSVQYRFRIAQQDETVGNADVKKGQALILVHASANRDPAQFGCPAHADLSRARPTDHLTFNKGPRSCVGAGLARVEMRDSIEAVLDRLPNLRLDPDAEPPRFASLFMRSWRPLNVRYDPPSA